MRIWRRQILWICGFQSETLWLLYSVFILECGNKLPL